MARSSNVEAEPVVAVCGNEARVYGPVGPDGKRKFEYMRVFAHHGAARFFAQEFETVTAK